MLLQLCVLFIGMGFVLGAAAAPPTLAAISNLTVVIDRPTDAIQLYVADAETAELSLLLRGVSSNTNLVTTDNIFFGVAFNTWFLTVTPTFGQTGACNISVIVRDGQGEEATNTFLFTVNGVPPGRSRFVQPQPILIPGSGFNRRGGAEAVLPARVSVM